MGTGELGKTFEDGETIIRQGDDGDCMYVVQAGEAEVVVQGSGGEVRLSTLKEGDVFGEMALFTRSKRSATIRALGRVRVLTVEKHGFLKRVHEDPSLAYRILEKMSQRIEALNAEVLRLRG